ncbi:polysaccharide deacetylase family protein [Alicyclobacillus tolerans]|uniref:polysaccharide deacetylase family protein n=1 Tax=Alicyclobacillus tolerans TaxID=90970 RepID=UPI0035567E74|nr:polysaccharide deacetylase family protein [Alicyclobacillus tolerans]
MGGYSEYRWIPDDPEYPAFASQDKAIYFTLDDGPSAIYIPQILNVLCREHVHATFVLGYRCRELPAIVRRMQREGHEVGRHELKRWGYKALAVRRRLFIGRDHIARQQRKWGPNLRVWICMIQKSLESRFCVGR